MRRKSDASFNPFTKGPMNKPTAIFTTRSRPDATGLQDFEVAWTEQVAPGYGSPRTEYCRSRRVAEVAAAFRRHGFQIQIRREER